MSVFPNFSRRPSSRIVPLVFLFLGLSVLIIFLYALHLSSSKPVIQTNDALWHDTILCHAMGAINTDTYTNSLEAFESSYAAGFRTFEVDLLMTSDNEVVLMHDWNKRMQPDLEKGYIPTLAEFRAAPILGKYTPLSFKDLLTIAKEHPDIYIVTDSKYTEKEAVKKEFTQMIKDAEETDSLDVLNRFVVQLYNEEMYDCIQQIYPFDQYIFTLYQRWEGDDLEELEKICQWSIDAQVPSITMWSNFISDPVRKTVQKYGLQLYGHTVDDPEEAAKLLKHNVGIYTNVITPDEARRLTGK